jgi:hypothetical protein
MPTAHIKRYGTAARLWTLQVKEHLGHQSIRVTSDRYGHLFPSATNALADALDATFAGTAETTLNEQTADFSLTKGRVVAISSGQKQAI